MGVWAYGIFSLNIAGGVGGLPQKMFEILKNFMSF